MKKIISFLFFLTFTLVGFSQSSFYVTGKVVNKTTLLPMHRASVFAQNTTLGTVTDSLGNFTLWLPNGGYDLIVTYTGYETESKRITTADEKDKTIVIEIQEKQKELEEVIVVASSEVKDGWEKYGYFFLDNFLGKSKFGYSCTIKNISVLKFYYSKKKNKLRIIAAEPLEIQNDALGYKIQYALDSFIYDYETQTSLYTGYPLYEEIQPADEEQAVKWQDNRLLAYNGSMLHFMRSVYTKSLKQNKFEIQFLVKNDTTEIAIQLKDFYGALNYSKDDSTQTVEIIPNQSNMLVLYTNEKPSKEYLAQTGDVFNEFQLSNLTLPLKRSIVIEQNGYYFDQSDITINGYWVWEKVGDALPYNYIPLQE